MGQSNSKFLLKAKELHIEEFIKVLKEEQKYKRTIKYCSNGDAFVAGTVYVWSTPAKVYILGRGLRGDYKLQKYCASLDGRKVPELDDACHACAIFANRDRSRKLHDAIKDNRDLAYVSSSAYSYYKSGKYPNAICYDLNKAYLSVMLDTRMPDTTKLRFNCVVEQGEVGFSFTGDTTSIPSKYTGIYKKIVRMCHEGEFADFVMPLGEKLFQRTGERYLELLRQSKSKEETANLKMQIVCGVGALQNHNPFLRAMIVETCNERIKSLMDCNTVYCNTDCIVSTLPRPDLSVGQAVGQFKIEHQGSVEINGANYVWSDGRESKRGFNVANNKYRLDVTRKEIVRL